MIQSTFLRVAGIAMLAAASTFTNPAAASVCSTLQAELATLPPIASRARIRSYERAIARQDAALARARATLRRAGCQGLFSQGRIQCAPLRKKVNHMTDNLDKLHRERAAMGDARTEHQRLELKAALERNECGATEPGTVNRGHTSPPTAKSASAPEPEATPRKMKAGEPFRTMCVRLCDGYYFPISYSVPPSQFPRDSQACQARCPGTQTELYAHRVPGEESADMVSVATGLPYRDLETAFAHRSPTHGKKEGCSCRIAEPNSGPKGFAVIAGDGAPKPVETDNESSSILSLKQNPDLRPRLTNVGERTTENSAEESRPVRVVGPKFLPDPGEAVDLQAPGPTRGQ